MNSQEDRLFFYPVEKKHLNVVLDWFQKEHVKEYYYGTGLENTLKNLDLFTNGIKHNGEYSFELWIACIGSKPFGFLMTSLVEGPLNTNDPIDKWYEEGKVSITLDLLIGEEEYLGRGLGHRMIQEFLLDKFPHTSKVLIDPAVTNTKAIHVYEKAGFEKIEQFTPAHDPKLHYMMHLKMDDLKAKYSKQSNL